MVCVPMACSVALLLSSLNAQPTEAYLQNRPPEASSARPAADRAKDGIPFPDPFARTSLRLADGIPFPDPFGRNA